MQSLAEVIFERTPQGTAKLGSSSDPLPRALRNVLLAVDGRSSVARYESFLTSLMPLDEKFAALEQLGLLRRPASSGASSVGRTVSTQVARSIRNAQANSTSTISDSSPEPDFEQELQTLARQVGLIPDNSVDSSNLKPAPSHNDASIAAAEQVASAGETRNELGQELPGNRSSTTPALQELITEMENFLTQAKGLQSLPVVIMVSQITSIEQLRQEFPSYAQLIRSYELNAAGEAHIVSLENKLLRCM